MKQFSQAFNVVSQHRLLKVLDETSQEGLAGIANLRDYAGAEVLYHEGEDATDVWVVVTGQVQLVKLTTKGHEFMIELAIPQDLFGAVFYADCPRYPVTAVALEAARVIHFPIREMHDLLARNPRFMKEVLADTCMRLCHAQHMRGLTIEDVPMRIAGALVYLFEKFGPEIPESRVTLAKLAGTTVESAIRFSRQLVEAKIIATERGRIEILSSKRLYKFAAEGSIDSE
ncbi:MAG: Crp/Fnr family transcriptional regulator [Chthoniobacterales bacterium]